MKLDAATTVLRPRGTWEAVDLGWVVARQHYGKLMAGWAVVALPVWGVICGLLWQHPFWALLLMWWVKPLLTRQPVFFLSRVLFGEVPRPLDFWRQWRTNGRGLLWWLTLGRISPARSLLLAVPMLEGLTGKASSRRCGILSSNGGGSTTSLCLSCGLVNTCLQAGMLIIIWNWLPETLTEPVHLAFRTGGMPAVKEIPLWAMWMLNGMACLGASVIEPLYATGGFALYINTRTHLEGWDIEVAFRRLSARLLSTGRAVACFLMFFIALPAGAQEAEAPESRSPAEVVKAIQKDPAFEIQMRKTPIYEAEEVEKSTSGLNPDLGLGLTGMLGWLFIIAAIVIIIMLVVKNRVFLQTPTAAAREPRAGPRTIMGMDITPQSLPDDVPASAWLEWLAGRPMEALRLLYRGSLAWLVTKGRLPVHESDTEGDCLRLLTHFQDPARSRYFHTLTDSWVLCAYGTVPPGEAAMQRLCATWPFSLKESPAPPRPQQSAATAVRFLLPILLLTGCGERKLLRVEEAPDAYKDEARFRPWLSAERLLEHYGTAAESVYQLDELPSTDHMLVLSAGMLNSEAVARSYRQWAQRGGHLVVLLSHADLISNDFSPHEPELTPDTDPMLRWSGISTGFTTPEHTAGLKVKNEEEDTELKATPQPSQVSVELEGETLKLEPSDAVTMSHEGNSSFHPDVTAGPPEAATLLSGPVINGRITFLASGSFFRNRWLGTADHAQALVSLAALENSSAVTFLLTGRVSFFGLLMRYAWMPLLGLALIIVLWLWRNLTRFGSIIPPNPRRTRHFGTQLDEAGKFLRERSPDPLLVLEPARRMVNAAALHLGITQEAADRIPRLAAASGLREARVRTAMDAASTDPAVFTAAAADLQRMLSQGLTSEKPQEP